MKNKGITLIALVITIIVLLILAGVSIAMLTGDNGLLTNAQKSSFATEMKAVKEQVDLKKTQMQLENIGSSTSGQIFENNVNITDKMPNTLKQEIMYFRDGQDKEKKPSDYNVENFEKYIIKSEDGKIERMYVIDKKTANGKENTYIYDEKTDIVYKIKQTKIGGKTYHSYEAMSLGNGGTAEDEDSTDTSKGDKTAKASNYEKNGDVYLNTPDLQNLDPEATYYITYDESGSNPYIAGRIDRIDPPENWYNYGEKKWANVVTVSNNQVVWWVWIPRYKYVANASEQMVDVKFVSIENEYKNGSGQVEELSSEYKMPESFKFGDEENEYKELAGYWMAKYETQEEVSELIATEPSINSIKVYTSKTTADTYNIFINGERKYENVTLPYNITGLNANTKYDICVANGENIVARKQVTTKDIEVSLEGLDQSHTYYVTYDENGNNPQIAGRMDKVQRPENWYNYGEKKWANIITVNGSSVAYWVWIPRYEYITINAMNQTDITYIPVTQTDPDPGYKIPDSFKFGDEESGYKQLAGYWISKYEVTEDPETIGLNPQIGGITVTASKAASDRNYDVYVDGELKYSGVLPHTIDGLEQNKKYEIYVLKDGMMLGADDVTTKAIEIDMTGLNKEHTYYVVYNTDGTSQLTSITEAEPENWYNYSEKRWANIVTKNEDESQEAWWVYIPRYEYKTETGGQIVDIKFIPKEQTDADPGYVIPDSFKFGDEENGYRQLAGYWISKYEVSE